MLQKLSTLIGSRKMVVIIIIRSIDVDVERKIKKVEIDDRFKKVLTDNEFNMVSKVDKYGRKVNK